MLQEANEKIAREAEEKRLKEEIEREKKMKLDEQKLKENVDANIKRIEEAIVAAIKNGKRELEIRFGNGHTKEPAWEMAVAQLRRHNRGYKFEIKSVNVWYNNYGEAANVDYVEAREWSEPIWELKASW